MNGYVVFLLEFIIYETLDDRGFAGAGVAQ